MAVMKTRHTPTALVAAAALAVGGCATSAPDVFQRQAEAQARAEATAAGGSVCPVVVANATDHQLDASYALQGERSLLGLIPAGRSLSFQVRCAADRIEAFGTAPDTGFLGGPEEYRTVAALDRTKATTVRFTLTDRVR